jgi:hypothetical protein
VLGSVTTSRIYVHTLAAKCCHRDTASRRQRCSVAGAAAGTLASTPPITSFSPTFVVNPCRQPPVPRSRRPCAQRSTWCMNRISVPQNPAAVSSVKNSCRISLSLSFLHDPPPRHPHGTATPASAIVWGGVKGAGCRWVGGEAVQWIIC